MPVPVDIQTEFRIELAGGRNIRAIIHDVCQLPIAHVSLNGATILKAEYNNCAVVILLFCNLQKWL